MARAKGSEKSTDEQEQVEDIAEEKPGMTRIRQGDIKPSPVVKPMVYPATRPLRCLIGGAGNIIKDRGSVTGQEYIFHAGQITFVDERDYPGLLARRTNPKSCCGGKSPPAPQPLYGVA